MKLVTKLLNSLKIEKACFVGYSMGGRLALQFAVNNPQMIKCLVLESSSPGIADDFERSKRIESDNKIIERIDKSTREEFLKFWLSLPIFQSLVSNSKINLEEIIKSRSQTLNKNGLIESLTYFGTGVMPHYHDQLSSLDDIPLLLIAGEHDLKYREILKKLHSEIKSSSFFTINDAGHNTHLENPAEFIKLLNRFLVDNC